MDEKNRFISIPEMKKTEIDPQKSFRMKWVLMVLASVSLIIVLKVL